MTRKNKTLILTGSFNPPTVAHLGLLLAAVEATEAERGVFVPANGIYVARKASRKPGTIVFDEGTRKAMLESLARADSRLSVNELEKDDDGRGHTYQTMKKAAAAYPDSECIFVLGADKLRILPRWREIDPFLRDFRFAVVARDEDRPEDVIAGDPKLSANKDRFIVVEHAYPMPGVSSSAFQELFRKGDPAAKAMVSISVYDMALEARRTGHVR